MSRPPAWTAAPEREFAYGQFSSASEEEYARAEAFCARNPVERARLLPSSEVERIAREGGSAWGLATDQGAFRGTIDNGRQGTYVESSAACQDYCLISTLPLLGGLYHRRSTGGVYFELTVHKTNGVIAIGTVCRPYPHFRLPGWQRSSAALHLDDLRKFYENANGGQESGFWKAIGNRAPGAGDTVGCGYEFGTGGTVFFTFNGERLAPDAFKGLYLGEDQDVYAAVGVDGENALTVNFGGDVFKWMPANEWGWRLEAHVGKLSGPRESEGLPAYSK